MTRHALNNSVRQGEGPLSASFPQKPAQLHPEPLQVQISQTKADYLSAEKGQSLQKISEALEPLGFSCHFDKPLAESTARLAYADLFEVTGPAGEALVLKVLGANSRPMAEVGVDLSHMIEKDFDALSVSMSNNLQYLPKVEVFLLDSEGSPLGILVEKVDTSRDLKHVIGNAQHTEKLAAVQQVLDHLRALRTLYNLVYWDGNTQDVAMTTRGPVFVDAGSFKRVQDGEIGKEGQLERYLKEQIEEI